MYQNEKKRASDMQRTPEYVLRFMDIEDKFAKGAVSKTEMQRLIDELI
jgi:hypothetical protein